jgi:hypothetical protein
MNMVTYWVSLDPLDFIGSTKIQPCYLLNDKHKIKANIASIILHVPILSYQVRTKLNKKEIF